MAASVAQAEDADSVRGTLYQVTTQDVATKVSLAGTVVPYREATLSAQLPGRVEYLAGEEGDQFKSGDLLLALDDDELLAQRQSAYAELANADAAARNAGVQYSRELYSPYSINRAPGGMGVPYMFDQIFTRPFSNMAGTSNSTLDRQADLHNQSTEMERSRNAILQAQSRIKQIDAKLRDARAYAPFDGVIVHKMVEVGDTVQPGQPLYKFADIKYLQITVDVPARFVEGLKKNDILEARLDVGDRMIKVRVAQIFPVADAQRHTVTVKFDVPTNAPAAPGMYANVFVPDVTSTRGAVLTVPESALIPRGSLPAVYVVTGETYELRMVRVGEKTSDGRVVVLSGLAAGDWVMAARWSHRRSALPSPMSPPSVYLHRVDRALSERFN
ncbi:MAG: efflux RND transporter periplasmic adaptor subunit [Gammaproteobacteria bacterium]